MLVGLAAGAAAVQLWVRSADRRVLAAVGARPVAPGHWPRLENLVEGLCVAGGTAPPTLHLVEADGLNLMTVGRDPSHSHLVVTTGLVDAVDRVELEGIVARELLLVKSGHVSLATVAAVVGRFVPSVVSSALPPRSDLVADMEAVTVTRFPPGLVGALERLAGRASVSAAPRWTHHLWIVDPRAVPDGGADSVHTSIDERIATLREL